MATLRYLCYLREWTSGYQGDLWAVPKNSDTPPVYYHKACMKTHIIVPKLLDEEYVLCRKDKKGKFKEIQALWAPFDKERAPLNDNLLVYINGKVVWDNMLLAQRAKGL